MKRAAGAVVLAGLLELYPRINEVNDVRAEQDIVNKGFGDAP
jgi:hypothetical protein